MWKFGFYGVKGCFLFSRKLKIRLENIYKMAEMPIYFLTLNDERKGEMNSDDKSQFGNLKGAK